MRPSTISTLYRITAIPKTSRFPVPIPQLLYSVRRNMASSSENKVEWLVVIPDKEGTVEKRMAVRPQHLSSLTPRVEAGFWKMGGAFLNTIPTPNTTPDFAGSCMIAYASSKEEVLAVVNQDIYAKEGVWDLEKMTIFPFKAAFRKELE